MKLIMTKNICLREMIKRCHS